MQAKAMKEDALQVYEIGYLLVSSIPEEKVVSETAILKEILSKKGAIFIAEESPELKTLAYKMSKKIGAVNHKFDQAYFGWFKFELDKKEILAVKKSFEENPNMLRMLLINTVKEPTYLGKKASENLSSKGEDTKVEETVDAQPDLGLDIAPSSTASDSVSTSIEEMDKSIDEMVKGA